MTKEKRTIPHQNSRHKPAHKSAHKSAKKLDNKSGHKPYGKAKRQNSRPQQSAAQKSAKQESLIKLFDQSISAERIAKKIAHAGFCSRRDAERWIEDGRVSVNGTVLLSPAYNAKPDDIITVDGKPLQAAEAPRLWRYYKPRGLVVSHRDEKDRATVFDNLPDHLPRVVSVGRLDLDSEGLLLLTNSGDLARFFELPDTAWTRKYRVRVRGQVAAEKLTALAQGISIDGVHYRGIDAQIDRQMGSNAWLTVILREGKNREIRKIMDYLGYPVSRLIRVSFGPFKLNQMEEGDVEEVKTNILRDQLGLPRLALRETREYRENQENRGNRENRDVKSAKKSSKQQTKKPIKKSSSPQKSSSQQGKPNHANNQRQKTRRPTGRS